MARSINLSWENPNSFNIESVQILLQSRMGL